MLLYAFNEVRQFKSPHEEEDILILSDIAYVKSYFELFNLQVICI